MSHETRNPDSLELKISLNSSFEFDGMTWDMHVFPLCPPGSLTTQIREHIETELWKPDFYLDWHDLLRNHQSARMHMYHGASKNVSFEVKLRRMQMLEKAIQSYDSLMQDVAGSLTAEQAETMVNMVRLPKPIIVVLDTGTPGLRKLFDHLKFPTKDSKLQEYTPKWQNFVELAKSGQLVNTWRMLKDN